MASFPGCPCRRISDHGSKNAAISKRGGLLKDDDVETFTMDDTGDVIMVIWVPLAKREQKPVYINNDLFGGTFRRNWEGDYHCTRLQVKTMLRDQAEETMDMEVLDEAQIEDLNKILKDIKVPFKMEGGFRIDDTPVHRAVREALANCIINTDFYGKYGVIIIKEEDKITLENPGYIRIGKEQMRRGGKSDPRNKSLMKMFNMIDIGEHAGSGVPNIFNVWEDEGWEEPIIEESFDPDRTSLILRFAEKQAIKTSDIAQMLNLSVARTRAMLSEMDDIESAGTNRTRTYRLRH